MKIELQENDLKLIVDLLQKSDPFGFYVRKLVESIIQQANEQIEEIKIVQKESK